MAIALAAMAPPAIAQDDAAAPADETPSSFFLWTDTSLTLLAYGKGFAVDPDEQTTFTLEHAHESKIGDFFMFIDWTDFHGEPDTPNTWYGEFGPRLSFGKMLDKDLSRTLFKHSVFEIKDVLLAMQYERGEDADLAEAALVGLGLNLDVRKEGLLGGLGKFNYVQLNFYGRAELTEGTRHGFHDMQVTLAASYPFQIGKAKFLADGYFDWVTGLGSEDWSYHLNPQISWDAGAAMWNSPGKLFIGVEVDLWWNKYQIVNSPFFDTNQNAVSVMFKYHL
ncbi:MAG TPA: outer membrane protein OmpK [Lysobacter sp.]